MPSARVRSTGPVLALLLAACGSPPTALDSLASSARRAIVNGEVCPGGDAACSATGAILTRGQVLGSERAGLVCSAVLIAPDAVLTAGHCTEIAESFFGGQGQDIETFFTLASDVQSFGRSSTIPPAPYRRITELVAHPDYDRANFALYPVGLARLADIGIGLLAEPLDGVPPAVVPGGDLGSALVLDLEVDIAGYGSTAAGASDGVKLRARSRIHEINDSELQVGDALPTPVTCLGDSGGPTLLELDDGLWPSQRLIAVTSRAYDEQVCEVGGVATRADAFRDWIDQTLRAACQDGVRPASPCVGGGGLAQPVPTGGLVDEPLDDTAPGCDCRTPTLAPWPAVLVLAIAGARRRWRACRARS